MNKRPVLVVMAAGMGSRYGGLKQIDPVGDHGQLIIDYSIYDARKAGFETVVFVIKHETEDAFREAIGNRISKVVNVKYAYQEIADLPDGYTVPAGRRKPWGTAHAILAARKVIDGPFAVVNADDYYGPFAFRAIFDYLSSTPDSGDCHEFVMVGYLLGNTVTEHGHVARGVCVEDEDGYLVSVTEHTHIEKSGDDARYTEDGGATWVPLAGDTVVSMNMWGLTEGFIEEAWTRFPEFLDETLETDPEKGEYFLPGVISALISQKKARVKVLQSPDRWYGVTYQADKPMVVAAIARMTGAGIYPSDLWRRNEAPEKREAGCPAALDAFDFPGALLGVAPFGEGHINDTFCVTCQPQEGAYIRFILQGLSTTAFPRQDELMENIISITTYLRGVITARGGDPDRETLTLIKTKDGKDYFTDASGRVWRLTRFIEGTDCFQSATPELFEASGRAFGQFQNMLRDYPAETLHETIPRFHDTEDRLRRFREAADRAPAAKRAECKEEIDFVLSREKDCSVVLQALRDGKLPLRVTHNDTKLNNILFDRTTGEGICVIDLDTTMPGLSINDFGDSIRFGANHSAEDEQDLGKVSFDLALYEVYTRGFLEGARGSLTREELEYLPWGARLMTLECGMRFLTDYLEGDHYFHVHYPGQNLVRCRTQFKLVRDMEEQFGQMAAIVRKYAP